MLVRDRARDTEIAQAHGWIARCYTQNTRILWLANHYLSTGYRPRLETDRKRIGIYLPVDSSNSNHTDQCSFVFEWHSSSSSCFRFIRCL